MKQIICILVLMEILAVSIVVPFKWVDCSNLYTYHLPLAAIDLATIFLIQKYNIQPLTPILVSLLALSVITHSIGGFAYVTYNEYILSRYDTLKTLILMLEIIAIIIYGVANGALRGIIMDTRAFMSSLFRVGGY